MIDDLLEDEDAELESEDEDKLETIRNRYRLASEAYAHQHKLELDDLRFQDPANQWSAEARQERQGSGDGSISARPCLSVPKLEQPVRLTTNQMTASHLGVHIAPLSPDSDDDVADVLNNLYRSMERESRANVVRAWAFDRTAKAGRGWYLIDTEYDPASDDPFDQRITLRRILHQDSVLIDPSAQNADFSDARYAFIRRRIPWEDFKRDYPKSKVATDGFLEELFTGEKAEWADGSVDGHPVTILVARYYYKTEVKKVLCQCEDEDGNTVTFEKNEMPEGIKVLTERLIGEATVKWCDTNGVEILEEGETNGPHIPVIATIGVELQPFDDKRTWKGIIRDAKDAQMMYNMAASGAVEIAALEPKAPWVMAEGQDEGHVQMWKDSNRRNFYALKYKPVSTEAGQPLPPPQRSQVDANRLQVNMNLLQMSDNFMQATTGAFQPYLGNTGGQELSGKAIQSLQRQSETASSDFLQNLAQISMPYEASIFLDWAPAIYDRPGRIVRTINTEDETEYVMLRRPYVIHPVTKKPIPVEVESEIIVDENGNQMKGSPKEPLKLDLRFYAMNPQAIPEFLQEPIMARIQMATQPQQPQGEQGQPPPTPPPLPEIKYIDLSRGRYSVAVSIGKSRNTLTEEGAEEIAQLIQAQPQVGIAFAPIYYKLRNFPGSREMSEIAKKLRDQQMPFLRDEDAPMDLETAMATIRQLQQENQMAQQQLQQASQAMQTDQAKQQASIQKAQIDAASRMEVAKLAAKVDLLIEQMRNEGKANIESMKEGHESKLQIHETATDAALQGQKDAAAVNREVIAGLMKPVPSAKLPLGDQPEPSDIY